MSNGRSNKKVANSLVALSSAAVLSVYGAGYVRTRAAADRIALQTAQRRSHARPATHDTGRPRPASPVQNLAPAVAPIVAEAQVPAVAAAAPPSTTPTVPTENTAPEHTSAASRPASAAPAPEMSRPHVEEASVPASNVPSTEAPTVTAGDTSAVAPSTALSTAPTAAEKAPYRDGTYFGWGTSRHGDIQAAVLVEDGKIVSATVAQCLTRYSCAWISPLPPRIVRDQGTTFDYVSGATESSDAFQDAVADALTHAQ